MIKNFIREFDPSHDFQEGQSRFERKQFEQA